MSSLEYDVDGLTYGVGTSSGHCLLYDLRSSRPLVVKEHQYGLPIKCIRFHGMSRKVSAGGQHGPIPQLQRSRCRGGGKRGAGHELVPERQRGATWHLLLLLTPYASTVLLSAAHPNPTSFVARQVLSCDAKIVKVWEREATADGKDAGAILTNIETPSDLNDVCVVSDKRGESGLMLMAGEQERVMAYYVPALGPAPKWCSFLDSITEELEEGESAAVYDDYKFVTRQEVRRVAISELLPLLGAAASAVGMRRSELSGL